MENAIELFNEAECQKNCNDVLDLCEMYHQTDYGMGVISRAWAKAKTTPVWDGKSLFDILSSHPNYVPEKGYIVFSNQYNRPIDFYVVDDVLAFYLNHYSDIVPELKLEPYGYSNLLEMKAHLNDIIDWFSDWRVNQNFVEYKGKDYKYYKSEISRIYSLIDRYSDDGINFISNNKPCTNENYVKMQNFRSAIRCIKCWISDHKTESVLLVDDHLAARIKEIIDIDVHVGTKVNKVIARICKQFGMTNHPEYNKQCARLGDAISPVQFTRHTVVSINRVDYLTASWGTDWTSCMNIDAKKIRYSSRNGMYGDGCTKSGTLSYMLDPSTVVVYTIDSKYDGKDFELQDKVNRCLFHVGEGKFIMGRVYPQGTDGAEAVYKEWRAMFQEVLSVCMGVPNYWKTEKINKSDQHYSTGTHYQDYECSYCNVAGWSWLKPTPDATYNPTKIRIGHDPICPCCGNEHSLEGSLECEECSEGKERIGTCARCGCAIYEGDDYIYCEDDSSYYCDWDCAERYDVICDGHGDCHYRENCFYDEYEEEYYYEDKCEVETEDDLRFRSEYNARQYGYEEVDGLWFKTEDVLEDDETGEYFYRYSDDAVFIDDLCFANDDNAIAYGYVRNENGEWIIADDEEEAI